MKSQSEVTQLCPTLPNPMDCSLPGSSVHGIFQARVLQWSTIAFSACSLTAYQYLTWGGMLMEGLRAEALETSSACLWILVPLFTNPVTLDKLLKP